MSELVETRERAKERETLVQRELTAQREVEEEAIRAKLLVLTSTIEYARERFKEALRRVIKHLGQSVEFSEDVKQPWAKIPPAQKFFDAWLGMWSDAVKVYAARRGTLYVTVSELSRSPPFRDSRSLDTRYIRMALDKLVKKGEAVWLDESRESALVWWVSGPELAHIVWRIAREIGLEYIFVSDIIDALSIPRVVAEAVLEHLVRQGMGVWRELNGRRVAVKLT